MPRKKIEPLVGSNGRISMSPDTEIEIPKIGSAWFRLRNGNVIEVRHNIDGIEVRSSHGSVNIRPNSLNSIDVKAPWEE